MVDAGGRCVEFQKNRPSTFQNRFRLPLSRVSLMPGSMTTPSCSTAAAFPRYITGEVVADSVALQWPGLFTETTGMTPLQFVTRQRITRAQQLIRETSCSLIEVGLEVKMSAVMVRV